MNNKPFKLLFTGGGSGGPTTPLLAVYEELSRQLEHKGIHCLFWGTRTGPEREMVKKAGISFDSIPYGKLRRYWSIQNLIDPLFILLAFFISMKRLIIDRPHVIVSAGSFVSVPVAYAAWLLRIPHVILQMDVKPGLANRLMAPVSEVLVYLFDKSASQFPKMRTVKIGPVIRSDIQNASVDSANQRFHLKKDKPVLLITGGGQGSLKMNEAVENLLDYWLPRFQVVHLTGKQVHNVKKEHPDYHPLEFVYEGMGDLITRSDIVITRAGLGIIGELAYLGKDAVLIPIPKTHQELNARLLSDNKAATILAQQEFLENGPQWWESFYKNYIPGKTGKNLQQVLPRGGTEAFAKLILQYCPK